MDRLDIEIKSEERKMLQDALVTNHKKNKFIAEIKNGLGDEIKTEPNRIQKKMTIWRKIKKLIFGI